MLLALFFFACAEVPAAATAAWAEGRRIEAVDLLAHALEQRPDDAEAHEQLVLWEIAVHRYASAWSRLGGLGPKFDATRGQVLYLLGRYEDALAFLDGADPAHTLARHDALTALGREAEARAALEQAAVVLGEEDARIQTLRGIASAARGDHASALAHLGRALALDPLAQEARFALGRSLLAQGKREEGLAVLAEHRRRVPLVDALEFAQRGLDLAPRHAPNLAELGDCERELGLTERAKASYERALELARAEEVPPIALRLARLLFEDEGRTGEALAVLERSFERSSDARLLVRAGDYLSETGRPADAVRHLERALELDPGSAAIRERLDAARARLAGDR